MYYLNVKMYKQMRLLIKVEGIYSVVSHLAHVAS